jgi:hypothetical protein
MVSGQKWRHPTGNVKWSRQRGGFGLRVAAV